MSKIEDHIKRFKKTGDRKWFSMIYEETMPRIYRYYYYKTMQRELSEDLTSEVFIRVYAMMWGRWLTAPYITSCRRGGTVIVRAPNAVHRATIFSVACASECSVGVTTQYVFSKSPA